MKSRLVAGMTAVLLALTLASCANPAVGRLAGVVYTKGGRDARVDPAEATLTATPKAGDAAGPHTVRTAGDGSFSLDLPPGAYELTGTLITRIPGGVTTPQDVTIVAGETTSVEVYAIYPGG